MVPLRPLGLGELLDGAITTIRRYWRLTLGLAALLVSVQQVIQLVLQVVTGTVASSVGPLNEPDSTVTASSTLGLEGASLAISGVGAVVGAIVGAVLTGMLAVVIAEAVLGRAITLTQVWDRVRGQLLRLVAGALLAGLLPWLGLLVAAAAGLILALANVTAGVVVGVVLGIALLIVPGAPLWALLSLTTPALVLERLGPVAALKRSWRLVRPDFWRVFGIRLLAQLIAGIVGGIVVVPFGLVAVLVAFAGSQDSGPGGAPLLFLVVVAIGGVISGAITQPFLASVLTLLYVDRRMRGEGLDIALQQAARASAPAAAPGWS